MIIKINKKNFNPNVRTVRFGYTDEEYKDIFGNAEHKLEFYNTSEESEYRINIDEVKEYGRVGVLLMLDMRKPGNRTLLKRALEFDCGLLETEYEIVSE